MDVDSHIWTNEQLQFENEIDHLKTRRRAYLLLQPFRVWPGRGNLRLQLHILNQRFLLRVHQKHTAWLETTLLFFFLLSVIICNQTAYDSIPKENGNGQIRIVFCSFVRGGAASVF